MDAAQATKLAIRLKSGPKNASTARHFACYTVGMRFGWRSILLAVAAALALACTSPTLPLPPPAAPTETAGTQPGTVTLSGKGAEPGAFIVIHNLNPSANPPIVGTTVVQDGTWSVLVFAVPGDTVQIWQETGGDESSSIDFTIQ